MSSRAWVIVVSREHARRGLTAGYIMANHGKRAPLARMGAGDRVFVYSPKTTYPDGEPLRAITFVGTVVGNVPEPSTVIPGGFRLAASLREITPVPLADLRELVPTSRLRFGCFELPAEDAAAIERLVG